MIDLLPLVAVIAFSTAPAKARTQASPAAVPRTEQMDQLLSKRALRRAKFLIQLRLHELHDERLACVRAAILRRLPWDLRPQEPLSHCLEADFSAK
ncbi:MAG TPA: hypothetical protein VFE36_15200 [Candidatus Baltobacteraceae bacterium]|jgi:hypothetical protein|nr:hypothetical protein [Candidatus Baltobacteraceae bacterium]